MVRQSAVSGSLISLLAMALSHLALADAQLIDEIVVTAQKREQSLLDVPISVTVLGGEDVRQRGIDTVQDLSFNVPGLTMREDGPGSYTIFLRGLANQYGLGQLVSLFIDEAPMRQISPVALDLERIEVLKGPQGTLWGEGAAGGAIRFITRRPLLDRAENRVEVDYFDVAEGSTGWKTTGIINVPLVENSLAFRFATSYQEGGGWIDQPEAGIFNGNGTELLNTRGKLLWAPNDRFEAEATIQVHRAETELGLGFEEPDRTVDIGPDRSKVMIPKLFDYTLYNLRMQYNLRDTVLTSVSTYLDHDHQYPFTYIPRPGNFSHGFVEGNDDRWARAEYLSQELRLASAGNGPLNWTIGAYYSDGENSLLANYEFQFAPDGDLNEGGGTLFDNLYYFADYTSKSYSLFADVSFDVSQRFMIGAGARYFRDRQTYLQEFAPGAGQRLSDTFDSVDPRVYALYRYSDESSIYASFAKGFRSGGFNNPPFEPYDPEKVYAWELGTRGVLFNGALAFDVAGFFVTYKDMVRRRLTEVEGAFLSETSNIAEVESKGIEIGLSMRATDSLSLTATGAWLDSEITDTDVGDPVNIPGDRTDYTPEWSFTIGAVYDFTWGARLPGYARVDYNYRDKVTYTDRSSFIPEVLPQESDSLSLLNARVGANWPRFDLEFYGLNLTNQNKWIDPYHGWANANRTRPRVIGARVAFHF